MSFLVFSIICSVIVAVLLKVFRGYGVDIKQAVAFNYVMAISLSFLLLKPTLSLDTLSAHWGIFSALGILLPSVFIIMSRAVEAAGIVRYDAAQRLSLVIPIIASFTLFGESLSHTRIISLAVAFLALICLLSKPSQGSATHRHAPFYLLLVWLGFGLVDILFKQMSKTGTAFSATLTISFAIAGSLIFLYLFAQGTRFNLPSIVAGLLLGAFNFGNIYFYIKAHQAYKESPTLVFASMSIGVICLGTLVGAAIFEERISKLNALGIVLAIIAVLLINYWR